uniref:Protein-export membrane protein SecG n=1 Tax=Candidatus Kentrum sp. TUN TaxID=2126343 RepID=A0A450ZDB1_9GAMM|nr:MAG: preprotein translocase subunit SecG [Candidatus Kentron sp. TUN]VFK51771.1 MAG: preprotein translocase subunit SecG [Candidatus Kentron sp. TUN]VFK58332.1 MAG: preprotein translocase subunit SecG [Candidatus Kentron sp. TUN]
MQQVFLVIHVLTALAIIALVLLQQGRGADAGAAFGSGASGTLFGSRGPATFLSRITTILAATFFLTSIALAYIATHSVERESVIEKLREDKEQSSSMGEEKISVPPEPITLNSPDSPKNSDTNDAKKPIIDGKDPLKEVE